MACYIKIFQREIIMQWVFMILGLLWMDKIEILIVFWVFEVSILIAHPMTLYIPMTQDDSERHTRA